MVKDHENPWTCMKCGWVEPPQGEEVDPLREWADFELECLWDDLRQAHRHRDFQVWTTGCEHIGERIKTLTAIIGPIPWPKVAISGIADGWFVKMNERLGITSPDLPDAGGVAYAQMWVLRQIDSVK
jgi:hypothetical protein